MDYNPLHDWLLWQRTFHWFGGVKTRGAFQASRPLDTTPERFENGVFTLITLFTLFRPYLSPSRRFFWNTTIIGHVWFAFDENSGLARKSRDSRDVIVFLACEYSSLSFAPVTTCEKRKASRFVRRSGSEWKAAVFAGSAFSKYLPFTLKRKADVFKFLRFWRTFSKSSRPYSRWISVDGRPERRNKAVFKSLRGRA